MKYYCDIEFEYIKKKSKKDLIKEALEFIQPTIEEYEYAPCHTELDSDVDRLHLHFESDSVGGLAGFAETIAHTAENCKKEGNWTVPNLRITSIHLATGLGGIDLPLYFS